MKAWEPLRVRFRDPGLTGLFPDDPWHERLLFHGAPFTGTLFFEDPEEGLECEIDYRDGLEHGFMREYADGLPCAEYRYAFGVGWGEARRWEEKGAEPVITDLGPEPTAFDPRALLGPDDGSPLRINAEDPLLEEGGYAHGQQLCTYYRGRPFTGIVVVDGARRWIAFGPYLPRLETTIRWGQRHGVQREYHPNGQLRAEVYFARDRLYGIRRRWTEAGKLVSEEDYGALPTGPDDQRLGRVWDAQGRTFRDPKS
jgi:hypothetical protein